MKILADSFGPRCYELSRHKYMELSIAEQKDQEPGTWKCELRPLTKKVSKKNHGVSLVDHVAKRRLFRETGSKLYTQSVKANSGYVGMSRFPDS